MLRPILVLLVATLIAFGVLVLGTINVLGQAPEKSRPGFLSTLKVGQRITLREVAGRYEISMFENGSEALGHKLIEVGTDYLTVEDFAGVTETRLPVFSIKSIVRVKVPRK